MMTRNNGKTWVILGLLLIAAALLLSAYNLYDNMRAAESAKEVVDRLEEHIPSDLESDTSVKDTEGKEQLVGDGRPVIPEYILNPNMDMPVEDISGVGYIGIMRIPVLELELPVISQWSYPNLKIAPCRYSGSAYLDNMIICAHNYSAHFGNLKSLQPGDVVTFTDVDGNEFCYEVVEVETLQPGAIEEMESGDWDLTMFTCTIGGRTRVTVRCEKVDE